MKKQFLIYILLLICLTGCGGKKYTITFVDEEKELSSITVKKGENIKEVSIPKKDGYIFVSWLKDGEYYDASAPVNEDITLSASWTKEPDIAVKHTITFDFGEYKKTQTVIDGEKAIKPEHDPTKEKHTFIGWFVGDVEYDFDNPVTKDILIVAKFKKNRIIITYDLNGANGTTQTEIDKDSIPERPKDPEKFGYNFINWTLDGKPYNFDFPLSENVTIKANFEAKIYFTIKFDTDGGNDIASEIIESGTSLKELPTPIKEDYTFKYWSYMGQEFDINTKVTENITLVAIYEENE